MGEQGARESGMNLFRGSGVNALQGAEGVVVVYLRWARSISWLGQAHCLSLEQLLEGRL